MDSFLLSSNKFDKIDSVLSMIVSDQIHSQRTWVVFDVMKFITAFPNVNFSRTRHASSMVNAVIRMLTPEQKNMLKKDKDDGYCISLNLQCSLMEAMIDLMHSVLALPYEAVSSSAYVKVDQALILCDKCKKLAEDMMLAHDFINTIEVARQNIIAYRADVVRRYDKLYPGKDPYSMPLINVVF